MKIALFGKGCEAILCENLAKLGTERGDVVDATRGRPGAALRVPTPGRTRAGGAGGPGERACETPVATRGGDRVACSRSLRGARGAGARPRSRAPAGAPPGRRRVPWPLSTRPVPRL